MKLSISNLRFKSRKTEKELLTAVSGIKGMEHAPVLSVSIVKEACDLRKKGRPVYCYTVLATLSDDAAVFPEKIQKANVSLHITGLDEANVNAENPLHISRAPSNKAPAVLIIGCGPAGMFAALTLANAGFRVTVLERGKTMDGRHANVQGLFTTGILDPESNICFGEGGAGTYSDGKLTTRKNHPLIRSIFETFVAYGAPAEILTSGKPHIGTDNLQKLVVHFRTALVEKGVEFHFQECVKDMEISGGRIGSVITEKKTYDTAGEVIIAAGHSASDTYRMLERAGVALEPKPFAMGVRCEHPQEFINTAQYGDQCPAGMPPADYRLVHNINAQRSTYSFCMCPGGGVICSSSQQGLLTVNGMSDFERNSPFANAALVVKVGAVDFTGQEALAGLRFREQWEQAAFSAGGGLFRAPAQRVTDFLSKRVSPSLPKTSYQCGLVPADLYAVLPPFVCECLAVSLREFDKKIKGYISDEAVLVGVETRTSSPVRVTRTEAGTSPFASNLFPAGEGAGYAGGIVSSALDGIRCAQKVIEKHGLT